MIKELYYYLTTNCPKDSKRYLKESISIMSRYNRHKDAWREHLDNCKEVIIKSSELCHLKRRALILGSGSLYDIPTEYLSKNFEEVILVDMIHMPKTKSKTKHLRNISFVCHDITESLQNKKIIEPTRWLDDEIDLVVSANLLSQLACPIKYLETSYQIQKAHIEYLQKFNCQVCLITDTEEQVFDKKNKLISTLQLIEGLSLPTPNRTWHWNISPLGEISKNRRSIHTVKSFLF